MILWVHIRRSLGEAVLHRERCIEVPSTPTRSDFWEGGWFEYPDKEDGIGGAGAIWSGASDEVSALQAVSRWLVRLLFPLVDPGRPL